MKKIRLTRGRFALVDEEDFEYINSIKWHISTKGYAVHTLNKSNIWMHRLILQKHNLYKDEFEIDHINRDRIDNRKDNLRLCIGSQNRVNTDISKRNQSGYKGVSWKKDHKKWLSQIKFRNNHYFLGYFDDIKEASNAYIKRAKELHGEFSIYKNL